MLRSIFYVCSLLLTLSMTTCYANTESPLSAHRQMLVVTSCDWAATPGTLQCFEREDSATEWTAVGKPKPVRLGEAGMAWGIGLYPLNDYVTTDYTSLKVEGDKKAPAGIFSLGSAFGCLPSSAMTHLKLDYLELNPFIEAVDDIHSQFYNCLVDNREVTVDWTSSEKMQADPHYIVGLLINHNFPNAKPGMGSAIFLHNWCYDWEGTSGCTSLVQEDVEGILAWLDKDKNPVLLQLPARVYTELQSVWHLPPQTLAE